MFDICTGVYYIIFTMNMILNDISTNSDNFDFSGDNEFRSACTMSPEEIEEMDDLIERKQPSFEPEHPQHIPTDYELDTPLGQEYGDGFEVDM